MPAPAPLLGDKVAPPQTALVVIDMQNDFCHPDGLFGRRGADLSAVAPAAARIASLVEAARRQGMLILWVRAHYDDVWAGPVMREALGARGGACQAGTFGADWFDPLRPTEAANEMVVTKHRYSAFWDSPIDLYLRANDIRTVVVTGTTTDVCVESTVRDAFFRNYFVVVADDATFAVTTARHEQSLAAMGRLFAQVAATGDLLEAWSNASGGPRSWQPEDKKARAWSGLAEAAAPAHTALVIVDMQNDFCHPDGVMGRAGADLSAFPAAIDVIARLLAAAREAGVTVVHVQGSNLPTARRANARGLVSEHATVSRLTRPGTWGAQQVDALAPRAGEPAVTKHRYSGFVDTDLETLLRCNGIRTVVVTGTATQTCVESTVRDAQMRDYRVIVPADATASRGQHAHLRAASLETMGLYFADVVDGAALAAVWTARSGKATRAAE